jgi:prohibitin 2
MQYAIYLPLIVAGLSLVALVVFIVRAVRGHAGATRGIVAALACGLLLYPSIVVTPPGHRGVIYSSTGGINPTERVEGVSFVIPYAQSAVMINVRTLRYTVDAPSQTSDLQEINVPISVGYHVVPGMAAELYRDVGKGYEGIIISPLVFQLAKAEVGQIRAVDFARQRAALAESITTQLTAALAPYGLVVEWVAVEDAVFDPAFIDAVKNKIIADEKASQEERLVAAAEAQARQVRAKAQGEADRIIIEATAQADANLIIAQSLTVDLLIWQRIIHWNGVLPTTLVGEGAPLDLLFNVGPR